MTAQRNRGETILQFSFALFDKHFTPCDRSELVCFSQWNDVYATKCFAVWPEEDQQRFVADGLDDGLANLANCPLITAVYRWQLIDFLYVPGQKGKKWMCWRGQWSPASWPHWRSITRWPSRHVCVRMLLLRLLLLSVYLPWQRDDFSSRQKRSGQVKFWSNCVPGRQILCRGRWEQPLKTTTLFWINTINSCEQCDKKFIRYFLFAQLSSKSSLIQNECPCIKGHKYFIHEDMPSYVLLNLLIFFIFSQKLCEMSQSVLVFPFLFCKSNPLIFLVLYFLFPICHL